jgi:hypothetical protein
MKKTIPAPLLILMLLFMAPAVALAQSATNADIKDWQGLNNIKSGQTILVETKRGGMIAAKFVSVAGSKLTLVADGAIHDLEQSDIQRIYRLKKRWSRKTTAVIGAAVGLLVSIPIGAKIDSDNSKKKSEPPFDESVALPAAVYGVAGGAGVGYLLGGNRKGKLLYEGK